MNHKNDKKKLNFKRLIFILFKSCEYSNRHLRHKEKSNFCDDEIFCVNNENIHLQRTYRVCIDDDDANQYEIHNNGEYVFIE